MQAVHELGALISKPLLPIMDKLKDALKLAGKTSQQINSHRRDSFKPSIPPELRKLMESPEEESEWLFGDNLKDRFSQLKGENSIRDEFLRKRSSSKGKLKATRFTPYTKRSQDESQDSSFNRIPQRSNYKAPQKPPGGGGGGGSRQRPQTQKWQKNSYKSNNQQSKPRNQHQSRRGKKH